jgi:hypothetical protein
MRSSKKMQRQNQQDNAQKIILDLCGGTGAWSQPYKDDGYDVRVITLPETDIFNYEPPTQGVYGILAAPTCTMFSLARTTAKTPRDLREGMLLVQRCQDIIRECRYAGDLKFWALENPMGYLRQLLGRPYLTFDPADYGDNYTKRTDLWGYFNEPKVNKRTLTDEEKARMSINNRILPELPQGYVLPEGFRPQQARRSMTSKCFAEAFYRANR